MRISNIQHYLGGADQVIAREVLVGNQFLLNIETEDDTIDFNSPSTLFSIKTEIFNSTTTESRGSIKIDSLTKVPGSNQGVYSKEQVIRNATNGSFDLLIPNSLISLPGTLANPPIAIIPNSQDPYIVVMKCQWTSGEITKSIRFLFIMRYQPQ